MPHSPRMAPQRSPVAAGVGQGGTICIVDPESAATRETVAELPGFTRGLARSSVPYALVGLSKIRETATFGGLPLTERLQ